MTTKPYLADEIPPVLHKPGDIVNGHILTSDLRWVSLAPVHRVEVVSVAQDDTTRFMNIGRSRTIVFKGERAGKDNIVFPVESPQDAPAKKRSWWKL